MAGAADPEAGLPPTQRVRCSHGDVVWREAGRGPETLVLLHGIGSGAGSWQAQYASLGERFRVLGWDAPGYGDSAPLATATPLADDYAVPLAESLDALGVEGAIVVGHSLGALMAAAVAARHPERIAALVLVSPARGYGRSAPAERERVLGERTRRLDELGIAGLAESRSAGLCTSAAAPEVVDRVRQVMARATDGGYRQAIHLLVNDDLAGWLDRGSIRPLAVLCGSLDRVTPPLPSQALAESHGIAYRSLDGLAHACYVEGPALFDATLIDVIDSAAPPSTDGDGR